MRFPFRNSSADCSSFVNRWLVNGQSIALAVILITGSCSETGAPPPIMTSSDSADQVIFGLAHTVTVDGVLRARLLADTAFFYEANQMYDLIGVEVSFFATNGLETSTLTSDFGTYSIRTGDMEAQTNVVGTSADGRVLRTDRLNYVKARHELVGPEPFSLDCEGRTMRGSSFEADPDFTNVRATNLSGPPCRRAP
jgi:LPS export ABC transporter protein LptC